MPKKLDSLKKAKRIKKGGPVSKDHFFLYLSLTTPHPRFQTSGKWLEKEDDDRVTIPPKDTKSITLIQRFALFKGVSVSGLWLGLFFFTFF